MCWVMISTSSFWISWLVYLIPSDLFKWSHAACSRSLLCGCKKNYELHKIILTLVTLQQNPLSPRYLKSRRTCSRYFLSFTLSVIRFSFVKLAISLHFGISTWQTIAILWHLINWHPSNHFGAFLNDLNPFVIYMASLFFSAVKVPFFSCVEQLHKTPYQS